MNNTTIILIALIFIAGIGYLFMLGRDDNIAITDKNHHNDETGESYEIYPGAVVDKITAGEDIVLLDVRTPEEYEEIHLRGAVLLPVQKLSQQSLADIGLGAEMKDEEIVIYCRSGARSKTAYNIMKSLGYTNIKSVAGGMIHWEEDNYPFTEAGPYMGARAAIDTDSDDANISKSSPRISLDRNFHDFGVIPQYGGTVQETFAVKNIGAETLLIGDITTSCSCTTATIASKKIEPGGDAVLTVVFDPDFHEEPLDVFKRTVFIPTNDPTTPEAEVVIQVDIEEGK